MSQLSNNSELLQSLLTRVEDLPFNVDTTLPVVKTLEPFIVPMVDEDGNQIIQSGEEKSIIVNPIHLEAHYVENPKTGLLTQYLTAKIYSNTDGIIESKNNYIYISGGSISGSNPEDPNIPSLIIYPSDLIGGVSGSTLQKSFSQVFSDDLFSMDMYWISGVSTISGEHRFYIGSNCIDNQSITLVQGGDSMGINPDCYDHEIISNGRILYPYGAIMTSIPAISGSDIIDLVPRDETNKDVPLLICSVDSQNPMAFYSPIRGYSKAVQVKLNDLSIFGNAKPEDVLEGKTFTSADGAVIVGTSTGGIKEDVANQLNLNGVQLVYGTLIPEDGENSTNINCDTSDNNTIKIPILICNTNNNENLSYYNNIAIDGQNASKGAAIELNDLSIFGNAKPEDVAKDKTFTAADGAVIEGTMPIKIGQFSSQGEYMGPTQESFIFNSTLTDEKTIIDPTHGSNMVQIAIDKNSFGDVDADCVEEGKTFTSVNGYQVTGALPVTNEVRVTATLAEEEEEDFIFSGELTQEKKIINSDTEIQIAIDKNSFGDVDASEVPVGKTFTSAKGYAQEGKMPIRYAPFETVGTFQQEDETDYLFHSTLPIDGAVMIASYYSSDNVYMSIDKSSFGDAGPTDVKAGKTFTSSKGVKIKGVAQMSPTDYISQTGTFTFNSSGKASIPITEKTLNNGGLVYYFTATAPSPFGGQYTDSFKIINGKVASDTRYDKQSYGAGQTQIIVPKSNGINVSGQGLLQGSYKFSSKTFNTSQRWTYTLRGISFDSL